jgi:hypothetical protein
LKQKIDLDDATAMARLNELIQTTTPNLKLVKAEHDSNSDTYILSLQIKYRKYSNATGYTK